MPNSYREIIESVKYTTEVQGLGCVKRLDDMSRGLTFTVSCSPESGESTDNPNIFAMRLEGLDENFIVYYSFNDENVCLQSIVRRNSHDGEE